MAVSWVGITLVDVAGLVLATGAAWGASKLATRRWGSTDLQGSPLWSWYLGQVFQVFVFPTIMIGALVLGWYTHAEEFTMERWLARGWTWELSDDGRPPTMFFERVFMVRASVTVLRDSFPHPLRFVCGHTHMWRPSSPQCLPVLLVHRCLLVCVPCSTCYSRT